MTTKPAYPAYRAAGPGWTTTLQKYIDAAGQQTAIVPDVVGDGTTDDRQAIIDAIRNAPDGAKVVIPPGTYRIAGGVLTNKIDNVNRSVHVEAYGAHFIKDGDFSTVQFQSGFEPTIAVTAVTAGSYQESEGETVDSVVLTLAQAADWQRGDLVKLFADDGIPYSQTGGTTESAQERVGQHFTVISVDGTTATLAGEMVFPFTQNVRVAKMQPVRCTWSGGVFDVSQAHLDSGVQDITFDLSAAYQPTIRDVEILRSTTDAFRVWGCFGATIDNVKVGWAYNSGTGGYGVSDTCSQGTVLTGSYFHQVRHAYSGGASKIPVNYANPQQYGGTYQARISNCYADSTTSTSWDTHPAQTDVIFDNCHAANATIGFGHRSPDVIMNNITTRNCGRGARIFDYGGNSELFRIIIDGWRSLDDGIGFESVQGDREDAANYHVQQVQPTIIRNAFIRTTGRALTLRWGRYHIENLYVSINGALTTDPLLTAVAMISAYVTGHDWELDYQQATGKGLAAFWVSDETQASIMEVQGIRMRGTISSRMSTIFNHPTTFVARVSGLVTPSVPSPGVYQNFSVSAYIDWCGVGAQAESSGWFSLTNSGAVDTTTQHDIVADFNLTEPRTYTTFPNVRRLGQRLTFLVNPASAAPLTVTNSATVVLLTGADTEIPPGGSMTLIGTGSGWRQI